MSFGENLQKLRIANNLSQQDLADTLGIGRSTLANYEQNKREPNYKTLEEFSKYFNVSVDYLLGLTKDKNDFNHKNSLNEIIYKQIYSLIGDNFHPFTESQYNFMEHIKDGSFPVTEGSIDAIADLFNTNSTFLLAQTDIHYPFDPMETGELLADNQIKQIFKNTDEIVKQYNQNKYDNYIRKKVNRAYNTLSDLGVYKLDNEAIASIEPETLSKYYDLIIKYIKDTIKVENFDKVISEFKSNNTDNTSFNNIIKTENPYYFDFFALKDIKTINDISNEHEFENYIAQLLMLNNYKVFTPENIIGDDYIIKQDIRATKDDIYYFIECKYIDEEHLSKKANNYNNKEKKYTIRFKTENSTVYKKILAISNNLTDDFSDLYANEFDEIWDHDYFKNLEKKTIEIIRENGE